MKENFIRLQACRVDFNKDGTYTVYYILVPTLAKFDPRFSRSEASSTYKPFYMYSETLWFHFVIVNIYIIGKCRDIFQEENFGENKQI